MRVNLPSKFSHDTLVTSYSHNRVKIKMRNSYIISKDGRSCGMEVLCIGVR